MACRKVAGAAFLQVARRTNEVADDDAFLLPRLRSPAQLQRQTFTPPAGCTLFLHESECHLQYSDTIMSFPCCSTILVSSCLTGPRFPDAAFNLILNHRSS
jgi:hypothetical protein